MILVDGVALAEIDARDRGLNYGDGLFETLAVFSGKIRCWNDHWQRLSEGCRRLGLSPPDQALLEHEVFELCRDAKRRVVKLILTRGSGPRGYRIPANVAPRRILIADDWPDYPPQWSKAGVHVRLCQTRLGRNPTLAGIKHCNRLEQVLARGEWQNEAEEGLMLDSDGNVIEGTMSNLFLEQDGSLLTPDLSQCGVAGVTRQRILDQAPKLDIRVDVCAISLEQVRQAQGMFLCNTLIGLWPIRAFEQQTYSLPSLVPALRAIEGLEAP